jgi:hypothetical protein
MIFGDRGLEQDADPGDETIADLAPPGRSVEIAGNTRPASYIARRSVG